MSFLNQDSFPIPMLVVGIGGTQQPAESWESLAGLESAPFLDGCIKYNVIPCNIFQSVK